MKEDYLTDDFIAEMRGRYFRERKWRKIEPFRKAAVLAIDLQKYFLRPESRAFLPSAGRFVPRLLEFYSAVRALNVPIIFTRHLVETSVGILEVDLVLGAIGRSRTSNSSRGLRTITFSSWGTLRMESTARRPLR